MTTYPPGVPDRLGWSKKDRPRFCILREERMGKMIAPQVIHTWEEEVGAQAEDEKPRLYQMIPLTKRIMKKRKIHLQDGEIFLIWEFFSPTVTNCFDEIPFSKR